MNALQRHDRDLLTGSAHLIGVDEAGRGALAGPVVAGACVLPREFFASGRAVALSGGINDSKQLSGVERERHLATMEALRSEGALDYAVGMASVTEIAELNILGATRLAMRRALEALAERATAWSLPLAAASGPLFEADRDGVRILVDGRPLKPFSYEHRGLVGGDGRSLSIAMASIAAKVTRDREMLKLAERYTAYEFARHKGYGTASHRAAILRHGACAIHRELFLRKIL